MGAVPCQGLPVCPASQQPPPRGPKSWRFGWRPRKPVLQKDLMKQSPEAGQKINANCPQNLPLAGRAHPDCLFPWAWPPRLEASHVFLRLGLRTACRRGGGGALNQQAGASGGVGAGAADGAEGPRGAPQPCSSERSTQILPNKRPLCSRSSLPLPERAVLPPPSKHRPDPGGGSAPGLVGGGGLPHL